MSRVVCSVSNKSEITIWIFHTDSSLYPLPMSPLIPQINTTEAEDISVEMGVDALPTIQFYRGRKMIGEFKGSDIAVVDKVVRSQVQKASA
jgi:hypothetical protein